MKRLFNFINKRLAKRYNRLAGESYELALCAEREDNRIAAAYLFHEYTVYKAKYEQYRKKIDNE